MSTSGLSFARDVNVAVDLAIAEVVTVGTLTVVDVGELPKKQKPSFSGNPPLQEWFHRNVDFSPYLSKKTVI